MKTFTALVSVALAVSGALGQALTINTPASAVVCQPLLFTWSGGTPPYFLSILPGNQPAANALVDFGRVEGTSLSWTVNLAPNQQIGLNLRDSSGALAQSAPFTIQSSTDTSCLKSTTTTTTSSGSTTTTGTGSTTSTTSVTTTTRATTTTTPLTTTTPATTTTTTPATRPATTTSTSPATSSTAAGNGAAGKFSQVSIVGAVGAVAAILLA